MDKFMEEAVIEARKALKMDEIPVGAVIIKEGNIIARAHNLKESLKDVTAHAEILAIREASKVLSNWRLNGCSMYVTLEPCAMCASAIAQARIDELYIGAFDITSGACGSVIDLINNEYLKYRINVHWTYDEECSLILSDFFKRKR